MQTVAATTQADCYLMLMEALKRAFREIHNPGANRAADFDITGHIEEVLKLAELHKPIVTAQDTLRRATPEQYVEFAATLGAALRS